MTDPKEVIKYIKFYSNENTSVIIRSALAYKYLYLKNVDADLDLEDIIKANDYSMGLIGPNNGRLTCLLEWVFGSIKCCHTHSILHDAYGRFYLCYKKDRGYCYYCPRSTNYMKKSPLFGHITGFWFSLFNRVMVSYKNYFSSVL